MNSKRNTESPSKYYQLEKIRVKDLEGINAEDALVPLAVKEKIPQIEKLVLAIAEQINKGEWHLFYPGVGTCGRLGILDASVPPLSGFLTIWLSD